MKAKEFKEYSEELKAKLKEITENRFFTDLEFHQDIPKEQGQYWGYEISLLDDNFEKEIVRSAGFFTAKGVLKNYNLSINEFFTNNDNIVKEFFVLFESSEFNDLIPILNKFNQFEVNGYSFSLNINSYIIGGDEWLRQVCEEYMLILHILEEDESQLYLGVQQNERYKIRIRDESRSTNIILPFDKCRYFNNYERIIEYDDDEQRYYHYEVALSFAGEDRDYVYEVADQLKKINIKVFYDVYETVSLWGKDLYNHLDDIYRNKSQYCVMFLSKFYKEKVWTNHERESAQARAFTERQEYILPVRLDNTEIPGIRPTTGYIDGSKFTPKDIADFIKRKVKENYLAN